MWQLFPIRSDVRVHTPPVATSNRHAEGGCDLRKLYVCSQKQTFNWFIISHLWALLVHHYIIDWCVLCRPCVTDCDAFCWTRLDWPGAQLDIGQPQRTTSFRRSNFNKMMHWCWTLILPTAIKHGDDGVMTELCFHVVSKFHRTGQTWALKR